MKECNHILGYLEEDEHERTHLCYARSSYNKKYLVPFQFCPLCGQQLTKEDSK